jgi:hypothetical protein
MVGEAMDMGDANTEEVGGKKKRKVQNGRAQETYLNLSCFY